MPFASITGQDRAISFLQQSLTQQRLAHTLLFSGADGVGKKTTALALAQALNCQTPVLGDSCGVCLACKKITDRNHPDVKVIEPDGQRIKIDQIRDEVQHQVHLRPLEGKYKVYIINEAESMTVEAANSLLKILEEPPATVMIILITSQAYQLLDTIQSRCQEIRFNPIAVEPLSQWLVKQLEIDPVQAQTLAMLSEGRPAEALRLAEPDSQRMRQTIIQTLLVRTPGEWDKLALQLGEFKNELTEILTLMLSWFRDLLVIQQEPESGLVVNQDFKQDLIKMVSQESQSSLIHKCQLIMQALTQSKRNINQQLLLEVLLMRLMRSSQAKPTFDSGQA